MNLKHIFAFIVILIGASAQGQVLVIRDFETKEKLDSVTIVSHNNYYYLKDGVLPPGILDSITLFREGYALKNIKVLTNKPQQNVYLNKNIFSLQGVEIKSRIQNIGVLKIKSNQSLYENCRDSRTEGGILIQQIVTTNLSSIKYFIPKSSKTGVPFLLKIYSCKRSATDILRDPVPIYINTQIKYQRGWNTAYFDSSLELAPGLYFICVAWLNELIREEKVFLTGNKQMLLCNSPKLGITTKFSQPISYTCIEKKLYPLSGSQNYMLDISFY